jgi:hypothetical protein
LRAHGPKRIQWVTKNKDVLDECREQWDCGISGCCNAVNQREGSSRTNLRGILAASRGGALAMRPLILHASSKATSLASRRVLHFVFGPPKLPLGLEWRWAI